MNVIGMMLSVRVYCSVQYTFDGKQISSVLFGTDTILTDAKLEHECTSQWYMLIDVFLLIHDHC